MSVSKRKTREFYTVSKSKLFKRYFTLIVAIILSALFILATSLLLLVSDYWWQEKLSLLRSNCSTISSIVYDIDFFSDQTESNFARIGDALWQFSSATVCDYFICDAEGNVIVCKDYDEKGGIHQCEAHKSINIPKRYIDKSGTSTFSDYTDLDGALPYRSFVVSVALKDGDEISGYIFAVEDAIKSLLPYIESISKMFLISGLVASVIALIASYFFSYGVAKPLSEMTEATSYFAKGDFTHKVNEKHKKGEMRELAMSLNKMATDLAVEDNAKKSFVANVSHELKTPMTTIGGFIDGILDGTIDNSRQREYLQTVSTEVKRLARLVVAMLNLSKIESGEINLQPTKYDIGAQMFETMLSFEQTITRQGIAIEGFEDMQDVYICADKDLLHQVLYNLVENAVKFTPQNGTISLGAKLTDEGTEVRIRNSGAGISQDEISRIFERFYKVDKSRSYDTKGVGLGLYIVKTIIQMHSGTISVNSVLGEYTEFTFTIPDSTDKQ